MAAEPHRYDHDEVHGNALIEQQRLAGGLVGQRTKFDGDDVAAIFQEQREREKPNVLQDIANQNPWKDRPMGAGEAQKVANEMLSLEVGYDPHYGARTVPSKPIEKVDRTERPGEDTTLTDRVHAAASTHELDEEVAEIFEDIEFNQRQSKRKSLKAAMDEVKELVDDDLEF